MRYDYYTIQLPGDLFARPIGTTVKSPSYRMWLHDMCEAAINEAKERARLWCAPCEWHAKFILGGPDRECKFRVRRRRN